MDQRAAGVLEELLAVEEAGSLLRDLSRAAENGDAMTLSASGRIEDRPEAIRSGFGPGEFLHSGVIVTFVRRDHRRVGRVHQRGLVGADSARKPFDPVKPVGASVALCVSTRSSFRPITTASAVTHTTTITLTVRLIGDLHLMSGELVQSSLGRT